MICRKMINNIDLYGAVRADKRGSLGPFMREWRHYSQATFARKIVSRLVLALVFVAVLPMLACRHGVAQAQNDPLNNAYKPSVDCTSGDYPSNVSLTNALSKLRQATDSPTSITGYGTTPLPCVTIYGTQNQFVSFQANIQAPVGGYAALTFAMSAMSKSTGPGGSYTIPAPSTSNNDIVVYRELYTDISSPNQSGHTWFDAAGYYPDALAPTIDPYWHQTTSVFPMAVTANQNQSAWIDVYIPEAAPSGWYSGTITISNSGTTIATLPVLVGVWQWPASDGGYMPSTPSLHSFMGDGSETMCDNGGGYSPTSLCFSNYPGNSIYSMSDLMVMLMDNRLTDAANSQSQGDNTAATLTTYETGLMNGATSARINTILPGAKLGPQQYNAQGNGLSNPNLSTWISTFNTNGWYSNPGTFQYLKDEPGNTCSNWTAAISNASASRSLTTPMLPMLVTADLADTTSCGGLNAVDWMIVLLGNMEPQGGTDQRSTYNTWLSGTGGSGYPTRQLWLYNSCSPNCASGTTGQYPNYGIDQLNPADETMAWFAFHDNATGILYYMTTGCFWGNNGCTTPWGSELSDGVYGDGNLVYPGTDSTNCSGCGGAFVGVSTAIWMPSIRLKLMRDGIQDYEYMKVLAANGKSFVVTSAYNEWISSFYCFNAVATEGATLSDKAGYCPQTGSTSFTGDITDAKIALGAAMHQLSFPPLLQPPTNPVATLQ